MLEKTLADAVSHDRLEDARAAIAAGANVNLRVGWPTITSAVMGGSLEMLALLLTAGADPNCTNDGQPTDALSWSVGRGRVEHVRLLLKAGARVEPARGAASFKPDTSALHQAVELGDIEIVELLLEADCSRVIDMFNYVSRTPLALAAERGNLEIARRLLAAGADPNADDKRIIPNRALAGAVEHGHVEMVRLLLDAGADPRQKGWMSITAIDYARKLPDPPGAEIRAMLAAALPADDESLD